MNKRQRKKKLKAKYGIRKFPRKIPIKYFDAFVRKWFARSMKAFDNMVLYGDQDPKWISHQQVLGEWIPPQPIIKVTGLCTIGDCLEPWRMQCTGCPFYETVERENDDK